MGLFFFKSIDNGQEGQPRKNRRWRMKSIRCAWLHLDTHAKLHRLIISHVPFLLPRVQLSRLSESCFSSFLTFTRRRLHLRLRRWRPNASWRRDTACRCWYSAREHQFLELRRYGHNDDTMQPYSRNNYVCIKLIADAVIITQLNPAITDVRGTKKLYSLQADFCDR